MISKCYDDAQIPLTALPEHAPNGIFVTGTDTDSGKTLITLAIMHVLRAHHRKPLAMKPVACGAEQTAHGLRNADALALQQAGWCLQPYALINPFVFAPPIAPELAAAAAGIVIERDVIRQAFLQLQTAADWVLVEGIGGWRVPLASRLAVSDLPEILDVGVLLVVAIRLGCINHALLTAEAIRARGARLVGWIATVTEAETMAVEDVVRCLQQQLAAPCFGVVPWLAIPSPEAVAERLLSMAD
jgi:dethiobiotin synthetase